MKEITDEMMLIVSSDPGKGTASPGLMTGIKTGRAEPLAGFEPATLSLRMKCATNYAKVALDL